MKQKMTLTELRDFFAREFPQVGPEFHIDSLSPMRASVRWSPSEAHLRPGGTVSGPTLFTLADLGVYAALLAMIGPRGLAVTTNASIDFMRKPMPGRDVLAEVTLLKLGRVLAVGDVLMRSDGADSPAARATLTYSIPPER